MNQTLQGLYGIILNGLPTFFLVLLLAGCVKYLYLKPLDKVLNERFRLTEGARQAAAESLKNADSKVTEYENALAQARSDINKEQAEYLSRVHAEHAQQIRAARAESDARVAEAKKAIALEADTARQSLAVQSDTLASQIADSILQRRVS